jgi:hypothetical protein
MTITEFVFHSTVFCYLLYKTGVQTQIGVLSFEICESENIKPVHFLNNLSLVRFEVFKVVTDECCRLGCHAVWLL